MASTSLRQETRGLRLWFTLGLLAATAHADPQPSFFWGFKQSLSTSLPECGRLQLFVNSSGGVTPPQPPYTLIAYEAGGIPTVQTVGSDVSNLWWTVDHPSLADLVLSMADAVGNAGGVAPTLYTVNASASGTACHPANPTSPVTLITNSTKSLQSCDVLPLKISGGTKPYTITIAPLGASAAINFTLGSEFDTLDWVNRASPNTQLIAAVSDAQGKYAGSTNLISTFGSNDLTCGNRQSIPIDSTAKSKSTSAGVIIGGIIGGAVLIGAVLLGVYFCLKARSHRAEKYAAVDVSKGFGPGGTRVPVLEEENEHYSAAELTPFVMTGRPASPYTDNLMYRGSVDSRRPSDLSLGPEMRANASNYPMPPTPGASSFPMQESLALRGVTPLPGTTLSDDGYSRRSIAPFSPLESTGTLVAGSLSEGAYAAYAASVAGSEARTGEAGPSSAPLLANNTPRYTGGKQGPVPPQTPSESVFQHQDISDVVELPPAYKERTGV